MTAHHLELDEARRIAVRAAMLDAERPTGLLPMIEQSGMLRVELTTTVCPAADHVAWSRLGDAYQPEQTERALADGELFERAWMLRPMSHLGLYLAGMRTWGARSGAGGLVQANAAFARSILSRIAAEGPLTSRDIPDEAVVPWPSTGWTNDRNVTKMLENLHMSGELAVIGRVGKLRIWQLASRAFPDVAEVPLEEAHRIRSEQLLRACGVMRDSRAISPGELHARPGDRGGLTVGEPATIEGVPGKWRVDAAALERERSGPDFSPRVAILSPFDRLMTDPLRVVRLFDFDYMLEMFKPVEQRIWGQFTLPILSGERLIGKIDGRSDRDAGRFLLHRIHENVAFDRATKAAVDAELEAFAAWMGLEVVRG
ncbi:MAG: crosslink repair DNA glycosylase YcaQ family protein [Pseudolysinimonas sp.]